MKILAVSDMVVDRFYSAKVAERFTDVEVILGCGDLPYEYLEFLVSAMNIPLLYVPGNHDPAHDATNRNAHAEGGHFLDLRVKRVKGLNIAGIGGSVRYRPNCANQYTQMEMYSRVLSLIPKLLWRTSLNGGVLDIVIAHSPPRGIHDDDDRAHIGLSALRDFIHFFKPRYFLHGHTLVYKSNIVSPVTKVGATTVINVNPYRIIEV
ncbi:MAG: metallophosphoesterase [Chloroflexota bacterium]